MTDSTRMDESHDNTDGQQLPEERTLTPREEAMNAVVEKQQSEQQQEADYLQSAKGQPPAPEGLPGDMPVYQNDSGDYVMRLKVDGAEQEMSLADVQATMQKHRAADERLRQAAAERSQLEAERQQWQQESSRQPPEQDAVTDDLKTQAQAIIDSLYDGDPDDAAEVLAQAMARSSTPVSTEQIRQEALNAIQQQEYNDNLKSGFEKFQSEFGDIMEDPDLRDMADRKTLELQSLHPDWSPEQILMESGRVIRAKFNGGQPEPQPNDRQARKQQLQPMPARQSTASYTPPAKQQPSNNPADVLSRMKKARGQY